MCTIIMLVSLSSRTRTAKHQKVSAENSSEWRIFTVKFGGYHRALSGFKTKQKQKLLACTMVSDESYCAGWKLQFFFCFCASQRCVAVSRLHYANSWITWIFNRIFSVPYTPLQCLVVPVLEPGLPSTEKLLLKIQVSQEYA